MHTDRLGKQLLALCTSKEDKLAEVKGLLESLTVDQRREVVSYKDAVSLLHHPPKLLPIARACSMHSGCVLYNLCISKASHISPMRDREERHPCRRPLC